VSEFNVMKCHGSWHLFIEGRWSGVIKVLRSLDVGKTWDTIRTKLGEGKYYICTDDGKEPESAIVKVQLPKGTNKLRVRLTHKP